MNIDLMTTIPAAVLRQIAGKKALEAGCGCGPSCIAGRIDKFEPPVDLKTAVALMSSWQGIMRRGHILLEDRTVLWFEPSGLYKYDTTPARCPPRPGVSIPTAD